MDFMMVDTQHSPVDRETLGPMLQAIKLGGAKSFARVAGPDDRFGIQQCFDLGIDGILVPFIRTAEDVQKAIMVAKYPTQGDRSLYMNLRRTFPL